MKFVAGLVGLILMVISGMATEPVAGTRRCATTDYMKSLREKIVHRQNSADSYIDPVTPINNPDFIFYIPVVVHIVWNTAGQNITDAQVQSQIDVLNEDYSRMNPDAANTPGAFASVASSTNFRFCLAQFDPSGNPTNGIERRQTTLSEFNPDNDMKHFSTGGLDAWDTDLYMNIWVCNLADDILGYAEQPDIFPHTNTFGCVIAYNAFGRNGVATPPYHLGRTTTHELGHCFNLIHTWGDDGGSCGGLGDRVADTPDQANETFNCVNFPHTDTCSSSYPGIMFMNYMDYSNDNCMNLFTAGQAARMYSEINNYYPALLASTKCGNVGVLETSSAFSFSLYPNPTKGTFYIDLNTTKYLGDELNVLVTNVLGEIISETIIKNPYGKVHEQALENPAKGIYFITLFNENYKKTSRIVIN
jgi:hypothetical protein